MLKTPTSRFASVLFSCLLATTLLFSQSDTSQIVGYVRDASGASVPNAKVIASNEATGIERHIETDDSGRYFFTKLAPGDYQLTATKEGFRTERHQGITLTVGKAAALDITLAVGAANSETLVTANAALVDTQSSSLSDTMDPRAIRDLPLNGRDFAQLALLETGVAPSRRTSDSG